ncbi:MAG: fasciclin domain-containing protein, partial [Roseiflexaceae bacterium]|nr:fasciclin domain-containing protein [Roseiflexaceae bacterium]
MQRPTLKGGIASAMLSALIVPILAACGGTPAAPAAQATSAPAASAA